MFLTGCDEFSPLIWYEWRLVLFMVLGRREAFGLSSAVLENAVISQHNTEVRIPQKWTHSVLGNRKITKLPRGLNMTF